MRRAAAGAVCATVALPEQNSASLLAPDLHTSTPLGPGAYLGALDAHHAVAAHAPSG